MGLLKNNNNESLFKSVMLAHLILALHLLLLGILVVLIFFFGWLVTHLFWIILGILLISGLVSYLVFRRLRREGRSLREALRSPMFEGRSVEIDLFGGMASFRLGPPSDPKALEYGNKNQLLSLEDPELTRMREIAELAELLEKNLITPEEYTAAKRKILGI
jgi:ABC-type multidrug transport system fused ATPase/permease subunit